MNHHSLHAREIGTVGKFFVWATRNNGRALGASAAYFAEPPQLAGQPFRGRRAGFATGIALIVGVAALPTIALAIELEPHERSPAVAERIAIEHVLRANGFVSWGEIEFDDGRYWEVDDARRTSGGQPHEVELAPGSLRLISVLADD